MESLSRGRPRHEFGPRLFGVTARGNAAHHGLARRGLARLVRESILLGLYREKLSAARMVGVALLAGLLLISGCVSAATVADHAGRADEALAHGDVPTARAHLHDLSKAAHDAYPEVPQGTDWLAIAAQLLAVTGTGGTLLGVVKAVQAGKVIAAHVETIETAKESISAIQAEPDPEKAKALAADVDLRREAMDNAAKRGVLKAATAHYRKAKT